MNNLREALEAFAAKDDNARDYVRVAGKQQMLDLLWPVIAAAERRETAQRSIINVRIAWEQFEANNKALSEALTALRSRLEKSE